jgi:hypothetical protein
MCDQIWSAELPSDNPFIDILPGKGKGEFAAYRFADVQFALAVNMSLIFKGIFIIFGVLVHQPNSAFCEFLHKSFCNLLFPLVKFFESRVRITTLFGFISSVGVSTKGKGKWLVVGEDRERVKSKRGKMEGSIGTLKTEKYGFNKPKECNWEALQGSGQESILSLNLNKFMKDLVNSKKTKKVA